MKIFWRGSALPTFAAVQSAAAAAAPPSGPRPGAPRPSPLVPVLVAGSLLMENIDATVLNVVTKSIAADFSVDPLQLKFALTAYLVTLSVGIPISGQLADRFGARAIFGLSQILFCLGSLGCGLSGTLGQMVAARLLQGAGGALMVPVARLVLLRSYPKADLVRITNLTSIPALLGPAIGPLLGGALTQWLHWRAVFFINVPLCAFGLWATRRALQKNEPQQRLHIDPFAYLSFATALCGLCFAFESVGDAMLSAKSQCVLWGASLLALGAYATYTAVVGDTLLGLRLLGIRTFRLGILGNMVSRLGVGSVPFLLPLMLQMRFGFTPLSAALHMTPMPLGMTLVRPLVSPLLKVWGFRRLLVANTLCLGISLTSFSIIHAHTPGWLMMALMAIYGMFASIHFACMNVLAYVDIEGPDMSAATGMVSCVHTFAMGTGVALGALLVAVFLRLGGEQPGQAAYAFHRAFACLGLATALSAVWFFKLGQKDGAAVSGYVETEGR